MFNTKEIETKWQKYWEDHKTYKFNKENIDKKLYCLEMFSYPSGAKLHIGHWYNYGVTDTWARFKRMQGFEVFHPMGFDAFGLPAENYAIKTGVHPKDSTLKNIETMEVQLKKIGATYDWDYEVVTCDPKYYKWTQWMFLKLYEHGLAYKKEAPVNWCPSCNTVLANEQVNSGHCERCNTVVERKKLSQWFFKITDYAQELLTDLDKLDWPDRTKNLQRNWIGKSTGSQIEFKVDNSDIKFEVFTTRADTLYGVTYVVLAPENDLVSSLTTDEYKASIEQYISEASKLSEIDRLSAVKEKTGAFTGSYAINPINNKKIPIWIADYVIGSYGTGAVMAVPAHDTRDYDFAKKYNLEIIEVVQGSSKTLPSEEAGIMINSGEMNGKDNQQALKDIVMKLNDNNQGKFVDNFRLRDWLVSRQRYWGAPIPIIYCDDCGTVPVPEKDLPVVLPYDVDFKPDGKSPLGKAESFVNTVCPKCGKPAKREIDTLDTFVCSSWYFLRYPSAKNDEAPFDKELINKMLPVDKYVGGVEHACMHLLYARFFTKALRDMGYLNFDEPFKSLVHQGVILGSDGEKMSKSKGNTVSPDEYVEKYGSDVFRTYLMFGFNYVDGGPWNADGIKAIAKFYEKEIRLVESKINSTNSQRHEELDKALNITIKEMTKDIERFQFNTSISRIMEYFNVLSKYNSNKVEYDKYYVEQLILLTAPFAPHLTEELWQELGHNESIFKQAWPIFDESKTIDKEYELVLQVNGKVRARTTIDLNTSEDKMKEIALSNPIIIKYLDGMEVVKIIAIPNKLVNIVIK